LLQERSTYARLSRARDYMAEHYRERISLAEAARIGCLSPYHFHRLFTATFGQTPHEFLTGRRIEEAKRRLVTGRETALEVCLDLGFQSPTTFSACFRTRVGCGPREYRASMRRLFPVPSAWYAEAVPYCYIRLFGVTSKQQD
jgi:AraC family transcriptional regulator